MKRREMLQTLGSAGVVGLATNVLPTQARAQAVRPFTVQGSGPALLVFHREPGGFYDQLTDRYRVVVIDNSALDNSPANIAVSQTADRVCADILAVADAAGVDRFAWFGFSFGSVVGLQLASRPVASRLLSVAADLHLLPICRDPGLMPKRKLRRVDLLHQRLLSHHSWVARARGCLEVHLPAHGIRRKQGSVRSRLLPENPNRSSYRRASSGA